MKVSVVIPTLNAEQWIARQLDRLLSQTVPAEILVIDSGSTDATTDLVRAHADRVRLLEIPRERFDHGGTRDYAFRQSTGDIVLFFTQDALPTDERCIENLLAGLSATGAAAAFGRQIARREMPAYERLVRQFNYPEQARTWRREDIPRYGIKAFFFSNAFSAYRREAYLAVGGFDEPIETNEDMMMAAKLLHAGYALAYVPDAAVYHAHHYTLRKEFRRNLQIGKVMGRYGDRLDGVNADAEGWRMLRYVCGRLAREGRYGNLLAFCVRMVVRLAGNRIGKALGKGKRPCE